MDVKNKYDNRTTLLLLLFMLFTAPVTFTQNSNENYLQMNGKLTTHPFVDEKDSLSAQEIIELTNDKGIPIWFGRKMRKIVCLTGECQIANLWLFWNSVGNYLGFQLYNNEPLTKTDHVNFTSDDYMKLHWILSDSNSILKKIKQDELTTKEEENQQIDGTSGATELSLKEYLVENAAYTCYTLWHTVYGNSQDKVKSLLLQKVNPDYISTLLEHDNDELKIWAINQIASNKDLQAIFNDKIMSLLVGESDLLSLKALNYFTGKNLADYDIQLKLVNRFIEMNYAQIFQIILNLTQQNMVSDATILQLLNYFESNIINAYSLSNVYKMIRKENLENPAVYKKISKFSNHENNYIKELSLELLSITNKFKN